MRTKGEVYGSEKFLVVSNHSIFLDARILCVKIYSISQDRSLSIR
jgi:hypothetical protein